MKRKYGIGLFVIGLLGTSLAAQSGVQGTPTQSDLLPRCVPTVIDEATGNCLTASSTPELGKLYPLGQEFNLSTFAAAFNVDLISNADLIVYGDLRAAGDLISGEVRSVGPIGVGTFFGTQPSYDLHIRQGGDAEIYLSADVGNSNEFNQPSITFSQDGGQVISRIGFFGGQNEFSLTSNYDADQRFNLPGGNADWEFWKLAGIAVDRRAYIDQSGNMAIDGLYSSGGADVAEYYPIHGSVEPGDLLTVSSLPGHAMKATQAGAVLGTALEGWQAGEGTILVLANLGYFSPTEDLERRVAELEAQVRALLKTR